MSIEKIFSEICKLNAIEIFELTCMIEKKFNLKNFSNQDFSINKPKEKKQDIFNVYLKEIGSNKLSIIKLVKEVTGNNLMDSKRIVDNLPSLIKNNVSKKDFDLIKKKFDLLGCLIEGK